MGRNRRADPSIRPRQPDHRPTNGFAGPDPSRETAAPCSLRTGEEVIEWHGVDRG